MKDTRHGESRGHRREGKNLITNHDTKDDRSEHKAPVFIVSFTRKAELASCTPLLMVLSLGTVSGPVVRSARCQAQQRRADAAGSRAANCLPPLSWQMTPRVYRLLFIVVAFSQSVRWPQHSEPHRPERREEGIGAQPPPT